MTCIGTLWGDLRQIQTKVILSVAAVSGLELEFIHSPIKDKPTSLTAKFLYGKIPAFEGTDGFKLFEGTPIARHVSRIKADTNLLGSNAQEAAIIDQWIHFAEDEIRVPLFNIMTMLYGYFPFNRDLIDKNNERLIRPLNHLESHLATRPSGYVALDTPTLADFVVASMVLHVASVSLGSAERARYPHIFAHFTKVTGDERVKQYWGTERFTDVPVTQPAPHPMP